MLKVLPLLGCSYFFFRLKSAHEAGDRQLPQSAVAGILSVHVKECMTYLEFASISATSSSSIAGNK